MVPGERLILPAISAAGPGPLYQQIVDGIRREVSAGRLAPGAALPSFRVLAEQLMVSVITVKRAYEDLERDGVIYRRQGLGTFVAELGPDRSREAKLDRARDLLRDAVRETREAGLDPDDTIELVKSIIRERRKP